MTIDLDHLTRTHDYAFDERFGMNVLDYDGVAWGPPTTPELVEAVKAFPLDPADVLVSAYPKSGTNWMQIMLANLWDDWGSHRLTGSRRVPTIDYIGPGVDGYDIAIASAPPRLMKNHLPADRMPRAWAAVGSKIVYLTRDPFDVCASFFKQLQASGLGFDADWDRWVERFARGDTIYGGWRDHVLGWHAAPADAVHHVSYAALRRDPVGEMRKVVTFLGRPVGDDRFDEVVENARQENMDRSGYSAQITVPDLSSYRSGGKVGVARARFSAAQVALFERELIEPARAAGIALEG